MEAGLLFDVHPESFSPPPGHVLCHKNNASRRSGKSEHSKQSQRDTKCGILGAEKDFAKRFQGLFSRLGSASDSTNI